MCPERCTDELASLHTVSRGCQNRLPSVMPSRSSRSMATTFAFFVQLGESRISPRPHSYHFSLLEFAPS